MIYELARAGRPLRPITCAGFPARARRPVAAPLDTLVPAIARREQRLTDDGMDYLVVLSLGSEIDDELRDFAAGCNEREIYPFAVRLHGVSALLDAATRPEGIGATLLPRPRLAGGWHRVGPSRQNGPILRPDLARLSTHVTAPNGGYRTRHADTFITVRDGGQGVQRLQPQAFIRPSLRQRECDMDARRPSTRTVGTRRDGPQRPAVTSPVGKKATRELIVSEVLKFVPGADGLWLTEPAAYKAPPTRLRTRPVVAACAV